MWLLTPVGFLSVVRKPGDEATQTLTVRARVHADLDRLRREYLPQPGTIAENAGTDYRYRASVRIPLIADTLPCWSRTDANLVARWPRQIVASLVFGWIAWTAA